MLLLLHALILCVAAYIQLVSLLFNLILAAEFGSMEVFHRANAFDSLIF